jgi:hypothetical protein
MAIELRNTKWKGHIANTWEMRKVYGILVKNVKREVHFRNIR